METPVEWCTIHDVCVGDFIEVQSYTGEWVLFEITGFGKKAILGHCAGCREFAWEDTKK